MRAAATIAVTFGNDDPRFLPNCTDHKGRRRYIPLLEQVFATAKKWTPLKRQECLPISVAILDTLLTLARSKISNGSELRLPALVRDAAILGTFTGSRISEYAQASTPAGSPFCTIPCNSASGDEGGKPVAFHRQDFTFFSKGQVELIEDTISQASYLRVRFRYTKGSRNFVSRMFVALHPSPYCPVQAAVRIVRRWTLLKLGSMTPLFCHQGSFSGKKVSYLTDKDMTSSLRRAAKITHPSTNHLVHQQVEVIHSQSLRVFACLCLKLAGWDEESISHQLRWNLDAVKYYIRQSPFQADEVGASLFKSALSP